MSMGESMIQEEEMHESVGGLPGAEALSTFLREDETKREFSGELRNILEVIARTGKYWHDWNMLKGLFSFRLKQVLREYNESQEAGDTHSGENLISGESFPELVKRLDQALNSFVDGPPFTLQRLSELLLSPQNFYPNISKASLALEKTLLVTSTLSISEDPYPSLQSNFQQPEASVAQQLPDANGAKENGNEALSVIIDEEMVDAMPEDKEMAQNNGHTPIDTPERSSANQVSNEEMHHADKVVRPGESAEVGQ